MRWISRPVGRAKQAIKAPQTPDDEVIYAIGDIHGRADLLGRLLAQISDDIEHSAYVTDATLVFLGDYVDRGPDSRKTLDRLCGLKDANPKTILALKGNHEAALLEFLSDPTTGPSWAMHGGRETLLSYGVAPPKLSTDVDAWQETSDKFRTALPAHHLQFLKSLGLFDVRGDYLFVHAGVRPGVQLEDQEERDLLWIREAFLDSKAPSDKMVVHGHTPSAQPLISSGRIGIDTGAYATGVLTALKLQGGNQSFLQTKT